MDYQLALKLKEAGFPQKHTPMDGPVAYESSDYKGSNEWASAPTLEELIEACGKDFNLLQADHAERTFEIVGWEACSVGSGTFKGKTAEEAVALVWLSLHQ